MQPFKNSGRSGTEILGFFREEVPKVSDGANIDYDLYCLDVHEYLLAAFQLT
jgi:hypothetical protein